MLSRLTVIGRFRRQSLVPKLVEMLLLSKDYFSGLEDTMLLQRGFTGFIREEGLALVRYISSASPSTGG